MNVMNKKVESILGNSNEIEKILQSYFESFYGAKAYSGWVVKENSTVEYSDLFVSSALSGTPKNYAYKKLLSDNTINDIQVNLHKIPAGKNLNEIDVTKKISDALEGLFKTLTNIPGIQMAIATKIIHKKRPGIIPILDSYVVQYYWGGYYPKLYKITEKRSRENSTLGLIDLIRDDLMRHFTTLKVARNDFCKKNTYTNLDKSLTPLRTLDIVIWHNMNNA